MKCEKCGNEDLRPTDVQSMSRFLWCPKCNHQTFFKDWEEIRNNNKYVKEYWDGIARAAAKRPKRMFPAVNIAKSFDDIEFDYDKAIIDGEFMKDEEEEN